MKTSLAAILLSTLLIQPGVFAADTPMPMPMSGHMQAMQSMMNAIRTEQDPEKRAALMQQHRAMMQQGMGMMGQGMGMGMGRGNAGAAQSMNMEERMKNMESMMGMMQQMMQQMMQHEEAEAEEPVHEHDE